MCEARGLAKIQGALPDDDSEALREGRRNHKITQDFLRTGKVPPAHERAVHKIIATLPVVGGSIPAHNIERVLVLPDPFFGFKDWSCDLMRIHGDLKFTSNVRYQRAKDPTKDVQRVLYSADHFYREPYMVSCKQTWSVSQFNGQTAIRLDHVWTRKASQKAFRKIIQEPVDKLNERLQSGISWNEANKNFDACDKYPPNGCPMKGLGCKRSLSQRLSSMKPSPQAKKLKVIG